MRPFNVEESITSVDAALEKLGGFSYFQLYIAFVILIAEIPTAAILLSLIFTGSSNVQLKCVKNATETLVTATDLSFCNQNCTYVIDEHLPVLSIVQEWQLICDRAWIPDFFTTAQMSGMMLGAMSATLLADTYGRKTIFFTVMATMGMFNLASGFANSMYLYGITRFLAGISLGGFYSAYYSYLMEFLTPSWRIAAGCVTLWGVGILTLVLLAFLLQSWRYLTFSTSFLALATLVFYPFIPESPRWLFNNQLTKQAEKSLARIAKMNKRPMLEPHVVMELQLAVVNHRIQANQAESTSEIYRNPELRQRMLIFIFGCFSVSTTYYSMSFNAKNQKGDPYLNVLYLGVVDLPAFLSVIICNTWLGRRKTYAAYIILALVLLVSIVIIDLVVGLENQELVFSIVSHLGRFGIAGAWGVVCCFAAESFPEVCRTTAFGICALSCDVGGVVAPQLAYLGSISRSAPYFIYAGLILTAACTTCFLPDRITE